MTAVVVDVAIVGGGIVGLATAYRLLEARPDLQVTVLEREPEVGTGQSSRNSGVLHAGLYYPPGSAKARWCTAGKSQLEAFCAEHGVPVAHTGKVVAAVDRDEVPRLYALEERARTNGVTVERLGPQGVLDHEPHLRALAGLWSPRTAVTDFGAVCRALAERIGAAGGQVHTGAEVVGIDQHPEAVRLQLTTRSDGNATGAAPRATSSRPPASSALPGSAGAANPASNQLTARAVVTCAGLQSDRIAAMAGTAGAGRIVPFRGAWLRLRGDAADLVRGNIYPVPLPGLPFLGVHLTKRIDGQAWIGPNAVLALAREGRGPWSVDLRDLADTLRFPGLYRLARRHLAPAVAEVWRDRVLRATVREVRRYVPEVTVDDVERGPWGVRAQLLEPTGELVDDFRVRRDGRVISVLNAPSPAATASLAIGAELRDQVLTQLA